MSLGLDQFEGRDRVENPRSWSDLFDSLGALPYQCNEHGQVAIAGFLSSKRLRNDGNQPVYCCFHPRVKGNFNGGHIFEISPQVGCAVGCGFCNCGRGFEGNLSTEEVLGELEFLEDMAEQTGFGAEDIYNHDTNQTSFSDGGELFMNPDCDEILSRVENKMGGFIKVSTTLPDTSKVRGKGLPAFMDFVSRHNEGCGLQISLLSTNEQVRQGQTRMPLMPFGEVRDVCERFQMSSPTGRQATLTFTLGDGIYCVPEELPQHFPPGIATIRVHSVKHNGLPGANPLPAQELLAYAERFRQLGYTVLPVAINDPYMSKVMQLTDVAEQRNRIAGDLSRAILV